MTLKAQAPYGREVQYQIGPAFFYAVAGHPRRMTHEWRMKAGDEVECDVNAVERALRTEPGSRVLSVGFDMIVAPGGVVECAALERTEHSETPILRLDSMPLPLDPTHVHKTLAPNASLVLRVRVTGGLASLEHRFLGAHATRCEPKPEAEA